MRGFLLFFCVLLAGSVNAQRYVGGHYSRVRRWVPTHYRQYHPTSLPRQSRPGEVLPESTRRQVVPSPIIPPDGDQAGPKVKPGKQKAAKRPND